MAKALLVIDLQEGYMQKYPSLLLDCVNERFAKRFEATKGKLLEKGIIVN